MAIDTLHEQVELLATQGDALQLAAAIVGAESMATSVDYTVPNVIQLGTLGLVGTAGIFPRTLGIEVPLRWQPAILHRNPSVVVPPRAKFAVGDDMELLEVDEGAAANVMGDEWALNTLTRFAAVYLAARHASNLPPVTILPASKNRSF